MNRYQLYIGRRRKGHQLALYNAFKQLSVNWSDWI